MNPKILIIFGVICIHAVLINGVDWSLAGGTLIATGASSTSAFALGPALVAGLLVAKVFGLGLLVRNHLFFLSFIQTNLYEYNEISLWISSLFTYRRREVTMVVEGNEEQKQMKLSLLQSRVNLS